MLKKVIAKLSTLFYRKRSKRVSHATKPQKPDLSQEAALEAIVRGDMD